MEKNLERELGSANRKNKSAKDDKRRVKAEGSRRGLDKFENAFSFAIHPHEEQATPDGGN